MSRVVLPGERIPIPSSVPILLGPGLRRSLTNQISDTSKEDEDEIVISTKSGLLLYQQIGSEKLYQTWIQNKSKRYIPIVGEPVIGIIVGKHTDGYRVDLGSSTPSNLDSLSFEGATKRSKPNLKIGTVVYARVSLALGFCESEIECLVATTQKSQGFGEMKGGMLLRNLSLSLCQLLINPPQSKLDEIGKRYKFEISIGMNGRIWVKSGDVQTTLSIMNEIKSLDQ